MRKLALLVLLVGLGRALPVPAASTGPEGDPASGVCAQIQAQKAQLQLPSRWRLIWDLIRIKLAPGSVARPAPQLLETAPERLLRLPNGEEPQGRNLVFSIEPPGRMQYGPEVLKEQARYLEVAREIRGMRGALRSFVQARDALQCVARVHASHFDFERFSKLALEEGSLQWVEQIQDGKVATRLIERALPRLRLRWELFRSTDLMTVFEALRSPQVRNVVIVTHALSEGSIIDSAFNEYPSRFFSDLSPTIQSISVFSCHGDKVEERYHISDRLADAATYHARRAVFTARGIKLLGLADVVPINGVGGFLEKIDRWVARERPGADATVQPAHPYCAIELSRLRVSRGGYALLLNNEFIGAVNADSAPDETRSLRFPYPCSLENRPLSVLVLKNINLAETSDLSGPERMQGRVLRPDGARDLPAGTHYRRADGSYQSSKWIMPVAR